MNSNFLINGSNVDITFIPNSWGQTNSKFLLPLPVSFYNHSFGNKESEGNKSSLKGKSFRSYSFYL